MRSIDNKTSGFSLMEMMVSIVIGMIIVAAASTMLVNILKAQKDISSSARLNQELGTAMAVMSNEIRRAGFSVCDDNTYTCKDAGGSPLVSYGLGEDIKIDKYSDDGDCILYRYNENINDNPDDLGEHRGFRLNGDTIQMAEPAGNVTCSNGTWLNLTDPKVFKVTALSFSTTGSKCRNMTKKIYWTVGDGATGIACEADTSPVTCTDISGGTLCETDTKVPSGSDWVNDVPTVSGYPLYTLFGVNQIRINLQATLTRDSTVSKNLQTSVKVANPWIQLAKNP